MGPPTSAGQYLIDDTRAPFFPYSVYVSDWAPSAGVFFWRELARFDGFEEAVFFGRARALFILMNPGARLAAERAPH